MRKTKIIATIGPKTESAEMLKKMGELGANIFRLNFSHGTHEWHANVIKNIQKINKETGKNYGILLDTKGPEIRTRDVKTPIEIKKGQTITFTVDNKPYEETGKIQVNYKAFIKDVDVGDTILIDNGFMNVVVKEKKGNDVICKVTNGGIIKSKRHLNIPGKSVSLPSFTENDWKDIEFGIKMNVDFLALSFVKTKKDIEEARKFLEKHKSNIKIISKIETIEAVKNINDLFEVSDGIMVARGDLGAETPFESIPLIQWEIKQKSKTFKKPVIVATQMLESMIENPIPTRAEVTDIFEAVWQRNDAIMLSGETTMGEHPLKAIEIMARVTQTTENAYMKTRLPRKASVNTKPCEFCKNAAYASHDLQNIGCIVVVTKTGKMARLASSFRPSVPIYAFTENEDVVRQTQLLWGTKAWTIKFSKSPEATIQTVIEKISKEIPEMKKKSFVLLSDILTGKKELTPSLQIREI